MRMEAPIARGKFDKEVDRICRHQDLLRKWGCILVSTNFPCVEAIFVPLMPVVVERIVKKSFIAAPKVEHIEHHSIAGRAFGVRVHLDDFDVRAPSVTFHDPWTWELAPYRNLPQGHHADADGYLRPVVIDDHPVFRRPFLCLPGTREYHEHPQHSGTDWFSRRHNFGLFAIMEMIAVTCCTMCRPRIAFPEPQTVKIDWIGWRE